MRIEKNDDFIEKTQQLIFYKLIICIILVECYIQVNHERNEDINLYLT